MTAGAALSTPDETTRATAIPMEIIRAARSGDHRAFEDLMIATERTVASVAWRILGDAEEVKEALQETFLRVFRHLKRYDEQRDFRAWLAAITIHVCRDIERRRKKRRIFTSLDEAQQHATPERIEDAIGARAEAAVVKRAIESLPDRERLAILLRDVEGLSTDEVSKILGNSPATVRVQLSKARAKVRAWVESWRMR